MITRDLTARPPALEVVEQNITGAFGKIRGKTFIFFKVEYDGAISTSENCDFLWKRFTEHTPEIWGVRNF